MAFSECIEVSLDCPIGKRCRRTVILGYKGEPSRCTGCVDPGARHDFPAEIVSITSSREVLPEFDLVRGNYEIEYEFEVFIDRKHKSESAPDLSWSRVTFTLTCACGITKEMSTQTNLTRPWQVFCQCRRLLVNERDIVPLLGKPTQQK